MASITLVITDGKKKGDVNVKGTFDPVMHDDNEFSLAQYLGTLCIEAIGNGKLARMDGLVFGTTIVEKL